MSDHQCPYCGSELMCHDWFGLFAGRDTKVNGDIYKCPKGADESEECESATFSVAGSFYTYREDDQNLHEGYPC